MGYCEHMPSKIEQQIDDSCHLGYYVLKAWEKAQAKGFSEDINDLEIGIKAKLNSRQVYVEATITELSSGRSEIVSTTLASVPTEPA